MQGAEHGQLSYFTDSTFWNNSLGIDLPYTHQTVLQNIQVIHALGDFPPIGVRSNGLTRNIVYDNLTVVGYAWGIQLPQTGYAVVRDGYYDNRRDFIVRTGLSPDRLEAVPKPSGRGGQSHFSSRTRENRDSPRRF